MVEGWLPYYAMLQEHRKPVSRTTQFVKAAHFDNRVMRSALSQKAFIFTAFSHLLSKGKNDCTLVEITKFPVRENKYQK